MSGITNRVGKVLVTNGVAAANLADNDPGQYLILDQDNVAVTATTVLSPDDKVQIIVNSPLGNKRKSDWIRIKDIKSYQKEAYRAKAEQVYTLTPGTPVAGKEYKIVVLEKTDKEILANRQARRTYSVVAVTGETATTLADKFRTKINNDPASIVIASGTATLILTAKSVANTANMAGDFNYQYVFDVFATAADVSPQYYTPDYQLFGTEEDTTKADFGAGNFWQINQLERELLGNEGVTNRTLFPTPSGEYLAVAGVNYDTIIIEHDNEHSTNAVNVGNWKAPITTFIYVTNGSSAEITAILDNIANSNAVLEARITALETP